MRSMNFLALLLLSFLSVLQLSLAEPVPSESLEERSAGLDIAPVQGSSRHALDGGLTFANSGSTCPAGTGMCPGMAGACCPAQGMCCKNKKCCRDHYFCYSSFCCARTSTGCDGKGCCAKNWNCCEGGYCCKPGYYCFRNASKKIRCCPNGKTCGGKPAGGYA